MVAPHTAETVLLYLICTARRNGSEKLCKITAKWLNWTVPKTTHMKYVLRKAVQYTCIKLENISLLTNTTHFQQRLQLFEKCLSQVLSVEKLYNARIIVRIRISVLQIYFTLYIHDCTFSVIRWQSKEWKIMLFGGFKIWNINFHERKQGSISL